jgi:hypothetical protein
MSCSSLNVVLSSKNIRTVHSVKLYSSTRKSGAFRGMVSAHFCASSQSERLLPVVSLDTRLIVNCPCCDFHLVVRG